MNVSPRVAGTLEAFEVFESADGLLSDRQVVELWEAEARASGHGERSIGERLIVIRSFRRFIGKPLIAAERADLVRFLGRPHLAKSSRQSYGSVLRVLYSLLQDEGWRIDNPAGRLPRVRVTPPEPDPLSTDEVQRLLNSCRNRDTRTMVMLGAFQGFRCVEIAAVHGRNIDWAERRILTAEAKGGKEVWRPLHSALWPIALTYPRNGYWFPNWRPNRNAAIGEGHILPNSVSRVLGDAIRRAGIQGHRPHQLRAWFATELLNAGTDTMTAQFAMRHSSQATLQRYVRPSQERIREAMERLPHVEPRTRTAAGTRTDAAISRAY